MRAHRSPSDLIRTPNTCNQGAKGLIILSVLLLT